MLPELTLVTGGIASGKSAFAEGLMTHARAPFLYVATAEARDAEMAAKIAAHQARRGEHWRTVEAPHEIEPPLKGAAGCGAVLVDCATMWLANALGTGVDPGTLPERLLEAIAACPVPVVVVTNEVGLGGISANSQARAFAHTQGRLNQVLASYADLVVLVASGLPLALKGKLP